MTVEVEDVLNIDDDDYVANDFDNLCYDPDYPYHEENTLSHSDSKPEEQSPNITINVFDPDFAPNYSTYIFPYNHPVPVSHMLEQPTICTLNAVRAFNCLRLSQPLDDTYSPTRIDNTWFSEEVGHLIRGGRHFKQAFLEGDRPGRTLEEEMKRNIERDKEEDEDDVVLKQLKKIQANVSIWGLLMASQKHRQALLNTLNKSQVSLDTTPNDLVGLIHPE